MKNCEQALSILAQVISERKRGMGEKYIIGVQDKRFVCIPISSPVRPEIQITRLAENKIQNGLNGGEWNKLKVTIRELLNRGVIDYG